MSLLCYEIYIGYTENILNDYYDILNFHYIMHPIAIGVTLVDFFNLIWDFFNHTCGFCVTCKKAPIMVATSTSMILFACFTILVDFYTSRKSDKHETWGFYYYDCGIYTRHTKFACMVAKASNRVEKSSSITHVDFAATHVAFDSALAFFSRRVQYPQAW